MKTCKRCKEEKEESEYRLTDSGIRLTHNCITCIRRLKADEIARYRLRNPTYAANRGERTLPERKKKYRAKARSELLRTYVKQIVAKQLGVPLSLVPENLVALKREQLLNKRLQKQLIETIGEQL